MNNIIKGIICIDNVTKLLASQRLALLTLHKHASVDADSGCNPKLGENQKAKC